MNTTAIRQDFPIFEHQSHKKPFVYLDSTATALKPQSVIDAWTRYMSEYSANIFRGIYTISEEATKAYEDTRTLFASFIHAQTDEIIFVRNATEAINLILYSWALEHVTKHDSIVTTIMEHHSNFVPWQVCAQKNGAQLKIIPCNDEGKLVIDSLDTYVDRTTKVFTITAVSNVLGTINDIRSIVQQVKEINPSCIVIVDAAQAIPHMPVDVRAWNADIVVCSGHKMLGPTGFGILWGKKDVLETLSPFLYGGEMIQQVTKEKTSYKELPHRFEAGTPSIAEVIAGKEAVKYLVSLGMDHVREHEKEITAYAMSSLQSLPYIHIYGPQHPEDRGGVLSFTMDGVHAHDIAQLLNEDNICIRAGTHCAMPLHDFYHIPATARASFYIYTNNQDIDLFIESIQKVYKLLHR